MLYVRDTTYSAAFALGHMSLHMSSDMCGSVESSTVSCVTYAMQLSMGTFKLDSSSKNSFKKSITK